jgi:hypothetical protein
MGEREAVLPGAARPRRDQHADGDQGSTEAGTVLLHQNQISIRESA